MSADIKTWQERMQHQGRSWVKYEDHQSMCMDAEIAELRAALRAPVQAQDVGQLSGKSGVLTEREQFEHAERESELTRDAEGDYQNPCVHSAWDGWQARAVLAQAQPVSVADKRDSERYRWWRTFFDACSAELPQAVAEVSTGAKLDAAIEQAIAALTKEAK